MDKLTPINEWVYIKHVPRETLVTTSGIELLNEDDMDCMSEAVVLAVGNKVKDIKAKDRIIYNHNACEDINLGDRNLRMVKSKYCFVKVYD